MTKDLDSAEMPCPRDVKIYTHNNPTETLELGACACRDTMDAEDTVDCKVVATRKALEHHRRLHESQPETHPACYTRGSRTWKTQNGTGLCPSSR